MLHEVKAGTTTSLGTNVVGAGVAFDGAGGIVRTVLFTDGNAYQFDYAGQHSQGALFFPQLLNPNRLALVAKLPAISNSIFDYGN